jgi:hypothetical protein
MIYLYGVGSTHDLVYVSHLSHVYDFPVEFYILCKHQSDPNMPIVVIKSQSAQSVG